MKFKKILDYKFNKNWVVAWIAILAMALLIWLAYEICQCFGVSLVSILNGIGGTDGTKKILIINNFMGF